MKKWLWIVLATFCASPVFSQFKIRDSCTAFTLKIEAKNLLSDTVIFLYPDCGKTQDTIILSNGKATINGNINRAAEAILFTDIKNRWMDAPSVIRFIIEPADMNLCFAMINDTVEKINIEGCYSQKEKETWESENATLLNLREKYRNEIAQLHREKQKFGPNEFEQKDRSLNGKIDSLTELLLKNVLVYVKEHPQSYFSGFLLYHYKRLLEPDTLKTYFCYLDSKVIYSDLGKRTLDELFKLTNDWTFRQKFTDSAVYTSLKKINTIYDVSLMNLDGTKTNFSKFKGNLLLIDFWASWCAPCIKNAPYLEKIIEEMKDKPLQVISISIDNDENTWKRAVKRNDFPGNHFFDSNGLLSTFYKVLWVPRYIIVNPDGTTANLDAPQANDPKLKSILDSLLNRIK